MPLLYTFTLIFGFQFATVHFLAEFFSLYWRYSWFDIPMHLLGGVLVLLIIGTLVNMKIIPSWLASSWRFPILLMLVLLSWEVFGIYRFGGLKPDFYTDSSLDLLFGTTGLFIGYYLVVWLRRMT